MLACQLLMFDDKTDSKSKWVIKHIVIIVWLCCANYIDLWSLLSLDLFDDISECATP